MKKLLLTALITTFGLAGSITSHHHSTFNEDFETGFEKHKVISSTPITKEITKKVRVGDIIQDRVVSKKVPCARSSALEPTNSIGLDTIIGVVAGVAIGNQFKNHKDAAKVIGGIGGGYIANQMRNMDQGSCYKQSTVQEYIPQYETRNELVTIGYNNCVLVDGKKLCKETTNARNYLKIKKTYTIY